MTDELGAAQRTSRSAAANSADRQRWGTACVARTVPRIDWNELLGVSCNRLLGGVLLGPVLEAPEIRRNCAPRHCGGDPVLMRRLDDARVVEYPSLHVDEIRMLRGRSEEGRAAIWAEVPSQLSSAFAALREAARPTRRDAEPGALEAHSDIEGATSAPSAIFAVAVVGRSNGAAVFECDAATEAMPSDDARHDSSSPY